MRAEDWLILAAIFVLGGVIHLIAWLYEGYLWRKYIEQMETENRRIHNWIAEGHMPTQAEVDAAGKAGSREQA